MRVIFGPLNLDDFPILYTNIRPQWQVGLQIFADALFDLDAGFRTGDLCFQQLFFSVMIATSQELDETIRKPAA